jgi:hypothetical protein
MPQCYMEPMSRDLTGPSSHDGTSPGDVPPRLLRVTIKLEAVDDEVLWRAQCQVRKNSNVRAYTRTVLNRLYKRPDLGELLIERSSTSS